MPSSHIVDELTQTLRHPPWRLSFRGLPCDGPRYDGALEIRRRAGRHRGADAIRIGAQIAVGAAAAAARHRSLVQI
jgi:hypothetical protein